MTKANILKVIKAYENNLKNISLEIPKNKITSITGVSGSGKSSLIYNVLSQEAKRREKIDSGHADCFDYAIRPKFEKIENLPYCVTLKQRGLTESISSTLATLTRLHELLREELVKYGEIITENGNVIKEPTVVDIKKFIQSYYPKTTVKIFAIVCDQKYTNGKKELALLKRNNIKEAFFISSYDDKQRWKKVAPIKNLNERYSHTILVPVSSLGELEKLPILGCPWWCSIFGKMRFLIIFCSPADKLKNFFCLFILFFLSVRSMVSL